MDSYFILLADGNPGAFRFVQEALYVDRIAAAIGFNRMLQHRIVGERLYMLWNDCCNRYTEKAIMVMRYNSIDDIIEHIGKGRGTAIDINPEFATKRVRMEIDGNLLRSLSEFNMALDEAKKRMAREIADCIVDSFIPSRVIVDKLRNSIAFDLDIAQSIEVVVSKRLYEE